MKGQKQTAPHGNVTKQKMTIASTIAELEISLQKWLNQDNNVVSIEEVQSLQNKRNRKKMTLPTRKRKSTSRDEKKKRRRRGSLKKKDLLLQYYFHISQNPSLNDKKLLSEKTGNTIKQVTDWFGNARRRLFDSTTTTTTTTTTLYE